MPKLSITEMEPKMMYSVPELKFPKPLSYRSQPESQIFINFSKSGNLSPCKDGFG